MNNFSNTPSVIGQSDAIVEAKRLIDYVAPTDATVLILGESGTGKEVIAQNIHDKSERRDMPFVPVNCGAIPEDLLESELFGHEKGAFTGAVRSRQGRFEMAQGGTLFLDEIGDMPQHMQVKLLRVLQERTFERVGGDETYKCDVRIIAATHQNLEALVEQGKFRMDLYYRLNVFPIEVAPLRERISDLPLLVEEFCERMFESTGHSLEFSECALAALSDYSWPGNVRELSNLTERLGVLFPDRRIRAQDLPSRYAPALKDAATLVAITSNSPEAATTSAIDIEGGIDLREKLQKIEISLIREALESSDWVVARSAKLLNLQRTTLVEKMRKYSIQRLSVA